MYISCNFSQKKTEAATPERGGGLNGGVNVFNEELQSKIEENALLHKQLQDVSTEFDIEVRQLRVCYPEYLLMYVFIN